jgi:hypothetical protein
MRIFLSTTLPPLFTCLALATPCDVSAATGGLIENPANSSNRTPYSQQQIENFLPDKGSFTFPAPYNTQAVRLTNADDCAGNDCIDYVGYSYWNNTNNHRGKDTMLIFVGMDRNNGGAGPTLLQYNKVTDQVDNLGPLFDSSSAFSWASGEGWYFSDTMPTALYVNSDSRLFRYDVITKTFTTVFDAAAHFGQGYTIWQMHSSADDRVHSATLHSGPNYATVGCMVYREDTKQYSYFPRKGDFDECQIDKSGKWLLIKENVDGQDGEDNRIINVDTGQERVLLDRAGAAGHSDMGYGYMVAADNFARNANTQKLWRFDANPLVGETVYFNNDWSVSSPAHVSHSNASPSVAPEQQHVCGSSANRGDSAEANEIVCFSLDGTNQTVVVAPVMTNLDASGGGDDYAQYPKGNLDVTGQYFIWTSNMGGNRLDAFLVKIPTQLLHGGTPTAPTDSGKTPTTNPPPPAPTGDLAPPQQTAIKVDQIGSSSARITWTTDEKAQDLVRYGTSGNYDQDSGIDTALVTSHSVVLQGLKPATRYYYRLYARDAAGNVATSSELAFTTAALTTGNPTPPPAKPPVSTPSKGANLVWSHLQNAEVVNGLMTKTGGCEGCSNSGGVSQQELTSGNGYMEFTADQIQGLSFVGVSQTISEAEPYNMDFALRVQNGYLEVREKGVYRADSPLASGDVLRISVQDNKVSYIRNGKVFYTSTQTPSYPLKVYARLYSTEGSIKDAKVAQGN